MTMQREIRGFVKLIASGFFATAFCLSTASAQNNNSDDDEDSLAEIVVTGSKVVTGEDSVSPVVVLSSERLTEVPRSTLNDFFVTEVTQNIGLITEVENGGQSGRSRGSRGASLNIRGLGEENTLILVNGVRTIEYAAPNNEGWRSVDINGVMPSIAVKRVEMLLDGGSAIYGTDAVAGVVNLIPDYDFRGLKMNYATDFFQGAVDHMDDRLGLMIGAGSEKTSIIAAFDYSKLNPPSVNQDSDARITYNPVPGTEDFDNIAGNSSAQYLPIETVTTTMMGMTTTSQGLGAQIPDLLCGNSAAFGTYPVFGGILGPDYEAAGGVLPDAGGGGGGMGMGMGGGGTVTAVDPTGCYEYANASGANEARNTENLVGMIALKHSFNDDVSLSMEWSFNDQKISSPEEYARNTTFRPTETDSYNNGYIISSSHPAIQYYNQLWLEQNPTADPATNPWANPDGYVPLTYANVGYRQMVVTDHTVEASRFGATLNWDITDNWTAQIGGVKAKHEVFSGRRDQSELRLRDAIQGLGGSRCNPATGTPGSGGCEYWNPMFSAGLPSAQLLGLANSNALQQWIYPLATQYYDAHFSSVSLALVGSLQQIKLGGGPIGIAFGVDTRKDELAAGYPASFRDGTSRFTGGSDDPALGIVGNPINNYSGETSVFGALIDINFPFTETFNVQLAGRFEDFDSGDGYTSFNPKIGFNWKATEKLTVRASYNTAFKAPTINHFAFFESLGTTTQSFIATDSPALLDDDVANDPDPALYSTTIAQIRVPNKTLQPQESQAWSAGILWNINDNLAFDLTYTKIDFEDIIFALNSSQTLTLCNADATNTDVPADANTGIGAFTLLNPFNGETNDPLNASCYGYIDPAQTTPDWSQTDSVFLNFRNLAERNIEAIDFSLRYGFETSIGNFNISPGGTYMLKHEESDLETGQLTDYVGLRVPGQFGSGPSEWRINLPISWSLDRHRASFTGRWISAIQSVGALPGDPMDDDYVTLDARYSYRINDNMSVSGYVNNVINEQPDNTQGSFPRDRRRIGLQFNGTFDNDMFSW